MSDDLMNWCDEYGVIPGGGQDCCGIGSNAFGFVTLAQAIDFARANGLGDWPDAHVWTITHGDGTEGEDFDPWDNDPWHIMAGVHRVNVIAFVVTRKPHNGTEVVQW